MLNHSVRPICNNCFVASRGRGGEGVGRAEGLPEFYEFMHVKTNRPCLKL